MKIIIEGEQGVGKTKIAKQIAEFMATNGYCVRLIDMYETDDRLVQRFPPLGTKAEGPHLTIRVKQTK